MVDLKVAKSFSNISSRCDWVRPPISATAHDAGSDTKCCTLARKTEIEQWSNEKGEQTFIIQKNISKSPSGIKKYRKIPAFPGVHHPKKAEVGKDVAPTICGVPPQLGDCNSDEGYGLGTFTSMPPYVKPEDEKRLYSSSKMKLVLHPINERFRRRLEKDGHNPHLELTLSPRKRISSVLKHLCNKWGISSTAMGELMLFPCNITSDKRWTSSEIGIRVRDVHEELGSPEIFCLRYGWFFLPPNTSSLSYPNLGSVENICRGTMENTFNAKNEVDGTRKELELSNEEEISGIAVDQTIPSELLKQVSHKKNDVKDKDFKPSRSCKTDNDIAVEGNPSDETYNEELRSGTGKSHKSLLWSDLSNISIGGLLSEASLQGRSNTEDPKLGGSRLLSHSIASDSLDVFIEKFKHPQDSITRSPDMPSSILDAESTCQSFAFSKPLPLNQDLPTFRQSALRGIFDQNTAPDSVKCPNTLKSENNTQGSVLRCNVVKETKTDPFSCSLGVYNNENSLGLSSLKWNDSLGPFDLFL